MPANRPGRERWVRPTGRVVAEPVVVAPGCTPAAADIPEADSRPVEAGMAVAGDTATEADTVAAVGVDTAVDLGPGDKAAAEAAGTAAPDIRCWQVRRKE